MASKIPLHDVLEWVQNVETEIQRRAAAKNMTEDESYTPNLSALPWSTLNLLDPDDMNSFLMSIQQLCSSALLLRVDIYRSILEQVLSGVKELQVDEVTRLHGQIIDSQRLAQVRIRLSDCLANIFLKMRIHENNIVSKDAMSYLRNFVISTRHSSKIQYLLQIETLVSTLIRFLEYEKNVCLGKHGSSHCPDELLHRKKIKLSSTSQLTVGNSSTDVRCTAFEISKLVWEFFLNIEHECISYRDAQCLDNLSTKLVLTVLNHSSLRRSLSLAALDLLPAIAASDASKDFVAMHVCLSTVFLHPSALIKQLKLSVLKSLQQCSFYQAQNYLLFLSSFLMRSPHVTHDSLQKSAQWFYDLTSSIQWTNESKGPIGTLAAAVQSYLYLSPNETHPEIDSESRKDLGKIFPNTDKRFWGRINWRILAPSITKRHFGNMVSNENEYSLDTDQETIKSRLQWFPFDPSPLYNLTETTRLHGYHDSTLRAFIERELD